VKFFGTGTTGEINKVDMGCYLVLKDLSLSSQFTEKEENDSFVQIFEIVRKEMYIC
jgi:hypothetical protein